jgi:hypothetical protein
LTFDKQIVLKCVCVSASAILLALSNVVGINFAQKKNEGCTQHYRSNFWVETMSKNNTLEYGPPHDNPMGVTALLAALHYYNMEPTIERELHETLMAFGKATLMVFIAFLILSLFWVGLTL